MPTTITYAQFRRLNRILIIYQKSCLGLQTCAVAEDADQAAAGQLHVPVVALHRLVAPPTVFHGPWACGHAHQALEATGDPAQIDQRRSDRLGGHLRQLLTLPQQRRQRATQAEAAVTQHLDLFQRISVDPASVSVVRYTERRPFVLRMNDSSTPLSAYSKRRRRRRRSSSPAEPPR